MQELSEQRDNMIETLFRKHDYLKILVNSIMH